MKGGYYMLIIIDPGHGGFDPGGGSNNLWREKDMVLKISLYQNRRFKELGVPSVMTRYADDTLPPQERIRIINRLITGETITISNHINIGGGKGAEVIHSIRDSEDLGRIIAIEIEKTGQNIRSVYTRTNALGNDYYFVIRETPRSQTIIIEYGFADNNDDQQRIFYNWPALAEAVVRGVCIYWNIPYTLPPFTVYTVRPKDSLYKIAHEFSTTIARIKIDNHLTSDDILVGQDIYIYR